MHAHAPDARHLLAVLPAGPGWPLRLMVLLLLWPGVLPPRPAAAQTFDGPGARAAGMAGAFVAVADDATATYWNPAGLATGPFFSLLYDRGSLDVVPDRQGTGASNGGTHMAALAIPALGLAYYRLRISEIRPVEGSGAAGATDREGRAAVGASLITHNTAVTLVQTVIDRFVLASSVRFVRGIATVLPIEPGRDVEDALEAVTAFVGRADNTFDVDVGAMLDLGTARLGLAARNLREPEFEAAAEGRLKMQRQARAGVAILPTRTLTLAGDVDLTCTDTATGERRHFALGAEQWLANRRVGVRAGFRGSTIGDLRPLLAGGISVAARSSVWIDAHVSRGERGEARGWGVATRVGF